MNKETMKKNYDYHEILKKSEGVSSLKGLKR